MSMALSATRIYGLPIEEKRSLLLRVSGKPSKRKEERVKELEPEEIDKALATWLVMKGA